MERVQHVVDVRGAVCCSAHLHCGIVANLQCGIEANMHCGIEANLHCGIAASSIKPLERCIMERMQLSRQR